MARRFASRSPAATEQAADIERPVRQNGEVAESDAERRARQQEKARRAALEQSRKRGRGDGGCAGVREPRRPAPTSGDARDARS
jgi:flagellar biosynthesis/type III secretory pathway protein FliH